MNKPKIRFNGYTDDWEQRKLEDMCHVTMGQSPDGSTYSEEPSDYILVQGNADLKDGWVYPRIWTTQKTKTAQAGDLIMSVRAPAGAMGKTAYDVVLGRGVAGIKGNEFVYQSLVKMDSDGYWKKMATGSTFESVNSDVVKNAEMIVPQDIEEQEKIGVYFKQIDTLITLHQRKCEKTKNLKKYMLQKMFPKSGSKVPEIRFEGFTNDWEQRKLGELTAEFTEYTTLSSELPLLTSSRAGLMYQNEYRGNLTTDSKETLFSVVPLGACTYRHMSDDDIFHLNINALEKGLVSREYPVFTASGDNELNFIVQHLNSDSKFRAFCAEQKKGGTRTRLYYKTLCEFSIMVPKSVEQCKISRLLLDVDHLITLHQRKCEELQDIKKFMLQNMFV